MSVHHLHTNAGKVRASIRLVATPVNATKATLDNSAKQVCTIKLEIVGILIELDKTRQSDEWY